MSKFGTTNIHDTSKNPGGPRSELRSNGERRLEIRPAGLVERFVDPSGHVVSIQLSSLGVPTPAKDALTARARHHEMGFIEHGKCPLRHGTRHATVALGNEFAEMPQNLQSPCGEDPKPRVKTARGIEVRESCPHIEWLIAHRREVKADINANRNASRVEAERRTAERDELQRIQLETAKEQLAAQRAKNAEPEKAKGK